MLKKKLLLHYADETVYDVYDTLQADDDDYAAVKHKLSVHFKPVKLTQYRVYTFCKTEQLPNETRDGFATGLHTLAKDVSLQTLTMRYYLKSCKNTGPARSDAILYKIVGDPHPQKLNKKSWT